MSECSAGHSLNAEALELALTMPAPARRQRAHQVPALGELSMDLGVEVIPGKHVV